MFNEGEYVIYGTNGVCQVGKITTLDFENVPKDREYYVLFPINNNGKIYVPVETGNSNMRRVITKTDAEKLITKLPDIAPIKLTNEKTIEDMYKKCIRCYDCTEWIRLIKCIYYRKQQRLSVGKKITSMDEKYMHMAEEALYSELGIALNIPKEQVLGHILKEVDHNKG